MYGLPIPDGILRGCGLWDPWALGRGRGGVDGIHGMDRFRLLCTCSKKTQMFRCLHTPIQLKGGTPGE